MPRRRFVNPAVPHSQTHSQIVNRRGGRNGARCRAIATEENLRRSFNRNLGRRLIDAYGRPQFKMRRQSYPELESSHEAESVDTAAVPHSASSLHPLHPARRLNAPYIVRINIVDRAFCEIPQGCDTGVRMEARCYWLAHIMIQIIKKYEGFQYFAAIVGWAP